MKDAKKIPPHHRGEIGRAIGRMLYSYRWSPHQSRAVFKAIEVQKEEGGQNIDILFDNDRSRDGKMWIVVCTNQGTKSFNRADEFRASLIQYYQLEEAISKWEEL